MSKGKWRKNQIDGNPTGVAAPPITSEIGLREPYKAVEKTFTTRPGGPDAAALMTEYINAFAIESGATLLSVHPIHATGSFLFVWEMP